MSTTNKTTLRNQRKAIAQQHSRLRKRKPKRQGSRNQSGKRLPVFRPPDKTFIHRPIRPENNKRGDVR